MTLSISIGNENAVQTFLSCEVWTGLICLISWIIADIFQNKENRMKTVKSKYRKDIEEERCRELNRTVLYDYDILYLKKGDEIYTYQDRPIEVIIKEVKQD